MSYLQALQKATKTNKSGEFTIKESEYGPGPSDEEMAELDKEWKRMPASKRKRIKKKIEEMRTKKSPERKASDTRNENEEKQRSIHQAKLRERYKQDKEWQDKREQTALQNQQKEVEAERNAEIKARNAEIKRKQKIKIDGGQVAVDVRRSNQEINVLQREMNLLTKKLVDAGDTKNRTVDSWRQERSDKVEEIAILKMEMNNKLVNLVDLATEKFGDAEGVKYLVDMGIDENKINEILSRKK
jgi:mRNA-degrading endonuclease RelE of RelBE toxin-antitoxin system